MALWSKVLSFFAGEAVGAASGDVLKPAFEPTRQNAWARRPYRVLDPGSAAAADAQRLQTSHVFRSLAEDGSVLSSSEWPASEVDFADDAQREGVGPARFDVLRRMARKMPPYAEALVLWRRERIDQATIDSILAREGIPPGLWPALRELTGERLDPEAIANAVQQSFVPDAGLLRDPVDGPPFDIPTDQVPLNTLKEFKAAGIDAERAKVMALLSGNPPAPDQLANMVMRDQISEQTFIHGLREGRTKTKWAKALLHYLTHPLLNPGTLVQRRLRGYDDDATFHRRMARYGYTAQQADDWFEASGRPLAPGQMLDLIARKGPSPTGGLFDFADFRQGMVESDIKPKYATPAQALYFKYPPLFQLRRAVESGGMTKARAREVMHIERYEQQDIDSLLDSWVVKSGTSTDPHVTKAHNSLWTTMVTSYTAGESDAAALAPGFDILDVPQAARAEIVTTLDARRALIRKQLTPAQLKKALAKAEMNPATNLPWTRTDVLARLTAQGMSMNDAISLLDL